MKIIPSKYNKIKKKANSKAFIFSFSFRLFSCAHAIIIFERTYKLIIQQKKYMLSFYHSHDHEFSKLV